MHSVHAWGGGAYSVNLNKEKYFMIKIKCVCKRSKKTKKLIY